MPQRSAKHVLAANIKALRELRKWSQQTLAEYAGIGQRSVSNMENPDRSPGYSPTLDAVDGVAKAFRVPAYRLLMALDVDVLLDSRLEKVTAFYARSTPSGRENIERIAESEMRYAVVSHSSECIKGEKDEKI